MPSKKDIPNQDITLSITVLQQDGSPYSGTVDVECQHQTLADRREARGADGSKTINLSGLHRAPQGSYRITVTPTAHFAPQSQFINVPASGFASVEFRFAMNSAKPAEGFVAPDKRPLTEIQGRRLATITGISDKEFAAQSVSTLQDRFRWHIDPDLFRFRRICGKVVKKGPYAGQEFPIPGATVHVEDTDCHLLGYFPPGYPWCWFFPFHCHREEIATVKTDECGRFCVWIPWFDIDWILRWRRARFCYPRIFIRPSIFEVLEHLVVQPWPPIGPHPPGPGPDPGPIFERLRPDVISRVEHALGKDVTSRLPGLRTSAELGGATNVRDEFLSAPAFSSQLPPPMPVEFQRTSRMQSAAADSPDPDGMAAVRSTMAARLHMDEKHLEGLSLDRFIGPFWRCFDILLPEWQRILDVPDITFRVTQDVDNDGNEEVIYSEGFFDVRWDSGPIPDVTLYASPIAVETHACDTPQVPCGDVPAILFTGLMPVVNPAAPADPYLDAATGLARRPNRPHANGLYSDPTPHDLASTPFRWTLQLYGCNHIGQAAFYRVLYRYNGGARVPFTGLSWPLYRIVGAGTLQYKWPAADANGWYEIVNPAEDWFPHDLLLEWETRHYADGLYSVEMELADAAKALISTSAVVNLRTDNSLPAALFDSLRWRPVGGAWKSLPLICPVIPRGAPPADIEIEVTWRVSATANHLRSAKLTGYGCGAGVVTLSSAVDTAEHWYTAAGDDSFLKTALYSIASSSAAGAYTFGIHADSRAFNPSGYDGGHLVDWNYDAATIYSTPWISISVVDANA